jgi:hypothetical protein
MSTTKVALSECDVCGCTPCQTPGFSECRAAKVRRGPKAQNRPRPGPQSTIEAIMWTVRERGPQALNEPANIERLGRCDDAAIAEIDARISKLGGSYTP